MSSSGKYTLLHRLLHWLIALGMTVLFITGVFRIYMLDNKHIEDAIIEIDGISNVMALEAAEKIMEPVIQWHFVFAHVVIFSLIARIVYVLVRGIRFPNPFKTGTSLKKRFQGLTYIYFYLFLIFSIVTGIMMEKGFFPDSVETISRIHKWGLFWFPAFIVLHITGVLIAEYSDERGISSKIIAGEK